MTNALRILIILGSKRETSFTRALATLVGQQMQQIGCKVDYFDPSVCDLPTPDPEYHHDPMSHPSELVQKHVTDAHNANAFIFASPIYHNSFSGLLKNALDHLSIKQFHYKPVALLSHGGDRSTQAVDQLRTVVRGLLGVSTPTPICTRNSDYAINGNNIELVSPDIEQRIARVINELQSFALALNAIRGASLAKG